MNRSLALVGLAFILGCGAAHAGPKSDGKTNPMLLRLHAEYAARLAQHDSEAFTPRDRLLRIVNDRVVVDAVTDGNVHGLESALIALGMQDTASFGRVVSGTLPISAIPALEGLPSL